MSTRCFRSQISGWASLMTLSFALISFVLVLALTATEATYGFRPMGLLLACPSAAFFGLFVGVFIERMNQTKLSVEMNTHWLAAGWMFLVVMSVVVAAVFPAFVPTFE